MSGDIIVAVMYTVVTVNNTERGNVRLRLDISMYSSTADTAAAAAQYRRVVIAVRVIVERRNHVTLDAVQVLHNVVLLLWAIASQPIIMVVTWDQTFHLHVPIRSLTCICDG